MSKKDCTAPKTFYPISGIFPSSRVKKNYNTQNNRVVVDLVAVVEDKNEEVELVLDMVEERILKGNLAFNLINSTVSSQFTNTGSC